MSATVPISLAEKLVGQKYSLYRSPNSKSLVNRLAGAYTLPESVAPHVDFIRPTIGFPAVQRARPGKKLVKLGGGSGSPNDLFVTPGFLRRLYNVGDYVGTSPKNVQSISSFLEQYFSYTDLAEFQKLFVNYTKPLNVSNTIGPNVPVFPGQCRSQAFVNYTVVSFIF